MLGKYLGVAAVLLATMAMLSAAEPGAPPTSDVHEGTIMAVTDDTIMLRDDRDNEMETFAVNAGTKIIFNGRPAALVDLQMGDRAIVKGQPANDRLIAQTISAFRPL